MTHAELKAGVIAVAAYAISPTVHRLAADEAARGSDEMKTAADDRRYAVGFRPVNAPPGQPFRYLASEQDTHTPSGQAGRPSFVFTHSQAQQLGSELARKPNVGSVSIQSKKALARERR